MGYFSERLENVTCHIYRINKLDLPFNSNTN